jgi:hypothetical protein
MEVVRAVEGERCVPPPGRAPGVAGRQQQAADVLRGGGVRLAHAVEILCARERRPHHIERCARAGLLDLGVESRREIAQQHLRFRQRRRPLLEHDERPSAPRDSPARLTLPPVVLEIEIRNTTVSADTWRPVDRASWTTSSGRLLP